MSGQQFAGKHVFIAGASSGINLGIAHGFADQGARLTVLSRSEDKIAAAAAELGNDALGVACDVRDFAGLEAAFARAVERHGPESASIAHLLPRAACGGDRSAEKIHHQPAGGRVHDHGAGAGMARSWHVGVS